MSLELIGETLAHKSDLVPFTEPLHLGGWQTPAERHRARWKQNIESTKSMEKHRAPRHPGLDERDPRRWFLLQCDGLLQ